MKPDAQIFVCGAFTTYYADEKVTVLHDRLGPFRKPKKPRVKVTWRKGK